MWRKYNRKFQISLSSWDYNMLDTYTKNLVQCLYKAREMGISEDELNAYILKKCPETQYFVAEFSSKILTSNTNSSCTCKSILDRISLFVISLST